MSEFPLSPSDDAIDPVIELLASERVVAHRPFFARAFGGAGAGLLLSQFWYYSQLASAQSREGWFYADQEQIEVETGLTRSEQETARRKLREAGVLRELKKGIPARLYYHLERRTLLARLRAWIAEEAVAQVVREETKEAKRKSRKWPSLEGDDGESVSPHLCMRETHIQVCGDAADRFAEMPQTTTETSPETSSETEDNTTTASFASKKSPHKTASQTQPLGGSVKIASRTQTQTAAAPPPPDVLLSQADPEDGVTFEAMLLSDPEPEPSLEPSPDSRLAMTAGRREVGRTTPPATLPSQQKTVDQRPAAPRPVAPASSVALGVFEEAYDPNNFVLTPPPLGGRENANVPVARVAKAPAPRAAKAPAPRAAKAPVAPKPPPGPTATAQFLDVFARRGIPPPRLLPRHHNNLKAYRQQVGDLFVQAVEDFTQTRWVIEKGYEACFLMGKTPEFWAVSSGRFIPAPATLWVTVPGAAAPPPHRDAHFVTYYTPTERWQYRMEGGVGPNGETEHDDAAAMAALPAAYRERMLAGMARRKAARLEREAAAAAPD